MAVPLHVIYADDSSDESQSDQSSPSSSDQTDHSSSLQKCPLAEYTKHGFCLTAKQKKKDDEQNNCIGSNVGEVCQGALLVVPFERCQVCLVLSSVFKNEQWCE